MTKKELRKIYLEKRRNLAAEDIEFLSGKIAELFFEKFDLRKINFLHSFLPIQRFNEIDTKWILHRVWADFSHIETLLPRVNFQTNEIENVKFTLETELVQNMWNIDEPKHNELVESNRIDAVLVPLLCFDSQGFRVGYGKGFYDKFLKNCRPDCKKIGLSYFDAIEKIEDINEFDVRLDFCLTPNETYEF